MIRVNSRSPSGFRIVICCHGRRCRPQGRLRLGCHWPLATTAPWQHHVLLWRQRCLGGTFFDRIFEATRLNKRLRRLTLWHLPLPGDWAAQCEGRDRPCARICQIGVARRSAARTVLRVQRNLRDPLQVTSSLQPVPRLSSGLVSFAACPQTRPQNS